MEKWLARAALVAPVVAIALALAAPAGGGDVLIAADRQFGKESATRGVAAWIDWFADDAVVFPASAPIVKGLSAIREGWEREQFSPTGLDWKPEGAVLSTSGDLGFTYGVWERAGKDDAGRPTTMRGKYLTVWKKQPDGRFKVIADIGNVAPPAQD